jgi:hypothetical protein
MTNANRVYVLYDQKSGQPLALHAPLGDDDRSRQPSLKRVREDILRSVEIDPDRRVAVLEAAIPEGRCGYDYYVDPKQKRLVPKSTLRVEARKRELEGDGEDSTRIDITAVDARGRVARSFVGEIVVVTTRGRLSERGGRVRLNNGKARIVLTSVPETVHEVVVSAYDPTERCLPGTVEVAFV